MYCGIPARTCRARLCLPCLEERFQKALRAWQRGWSRPLAAERAGLTEQEFLYQLDRRKLRLKDITHSRKRRRRGWTNTPEAIASQVAGRRAKIIPLLVAQPLPLTKRCNACKEIKPQADFYVYSGKAMDDAGNRSRVLSYTCKVCTRARNRKHQENMTEEQRLRRNESRREWENFHAQQVREEQGRERAYSRHPLGKKSQGYQSDIKLPLKPFQDWIRDRCAHYAAADELPRNAAQGGVSGLPALATACHISERALRRFLDGYDMDRAGSRRPLTGIPLRTVDECLFYEKSTMLVDLYPADSYADTQPTEVLVPA